MKLCHVMRAVPESYTFYLKVHCTDFIVKNERPPNSPDPNPLDCYMCGVQCCADILQT